MLDGELHDHATYLSRQTTGLAQVLPETFGEMSRRLRENECNRGRGKRWTKYAMSIDV